MTHYIDGGDAIPFEYTSGDTGTSIIASQVEMKVLLTDLGISPGDTIKLLLSKGHNIDGYMRYPELINNEASSNTNEYMDYTLSSASGNVGDTVTVWGTSTTLGGLIEVYWDSVKTWDGEAGLLGEDYAVGTNYEIDITIPEAVAGNHYIIVKDVEAAESKYMIFTVLSKIELDPEVGIIGDTITVTGTGFTADSEITLSGFIGLTIGTVPSTVTTNDLGSFTCEFDVPEEGGDTNPLLDDDYIITATDGAQKSAIATLIVGTYITLTPDSGLVDSTVTVEGRAFTPGETVDIQWAKPGESYITVVDDYEIDDNGEFSTTFVVPLVEDPDAPGDPYEVFAVDSAEVQAPVVIFTVVEDASISIPADEDEGAPGDEFNVSGMWFTEDSTANITFNGEVLAENVATDEFGSFGPITVVVPEDASEGTYTVTVMDEEGVSASDTFEVILPFIEIRTRATEYLQGDRISFYANCSDADTVFVQILDPSGVPLTNPLEIVLEEVDDWYVIAYADSVLASLPSDAPLGDWNFTAYDLTPSDDDAEVLDTNLFSVVELPTLSMILDRLDELEVTITGVVTDSEGDLALLIETEIGTVLASLDELDASIIAIDGSLATLSTSVGTVQTSLNAIGLQVTSIEGDVATMITDLGVIEGNVTGLSDAIATIETDLGTIEVNVSSVLTDMSGVEDVASGLLTPVYLAVVLSLIAALAAAYSVIQIGRKIVG